MDERLIFVFNALATVAAAWSTVLALTEVHFKVRVCYWWTHFFHALLVTQMVDRIVFIRLSTILNALI